MFVVAGLLLFLLEMAPRSTPVRFQHTHTKHCDTHKTQGLIHTEGERETERAREKDRHIFLFPLSSFRKVTSVAVLS